MKTPIPVLFGFFKINMPSTLHLSEKRKDKKRKRQKESQVSNAEFKIPNYQKGKFETIIV
jgi:hypothetical protein